MKKYIGMLLTVFVLGTALFGCASKDSANSSAEKSTDISTDQKKDNTSDDAEKISIVTTIFPEYDWVREIAKGNDNVEITMLLDNGVDLHSFQPTAEDIITITGCDMFLYVGGESDKWVEDALNSATNKDMAVVNLLDVLDDSVKEEELVEGMEGEEEEEDAEEEGPEYDEHVWLSLKNAKILCQEITLKLSEIDEVHKDLYESNLSAYLEKLDSLDQNYQEAVDKAVTKTLLFGDRFPFRYLADDYGLTYYAAFAGCSAESEASFETITFLAGKVDEMNLSYILQTESADGKIAQTIKDNTKTKDQEILTLDSMQSTTSNDVEEGKSYLSCMESNLNVLKQALQ